jgi:hypothetical protein
MALDYSSLCHKKLVEGGLSLQQQKREKMVVGSETRSGSVVGHQGAPSCSPRRRRCTGSHSGYRAGLVEGMALKLHPSRLHRLQPDFDGDQMRFTFPFLRKPSRKRDF